MKPEELKYCLEHSIPMEWNDPDPIEGNDYTIKSVETPEEIDPDTPILIQYGGGSEAEVLISEIQRC